MIDSFLTEAFRNPNVDVRLEAAVADAVGEIGPPAKETLQLLILATSCSHSNLREAAEKAIEEIHSGGPQPMNQDLVNQINPKHLGAEFMRGRSYCCVLDLESERFWSVVNNDDRSGIYESLLKDQIYRQVASIPTDGLVCVHATADVLSILRVARNCHLGGYCPLLSCSVESGSPGSRWHTLRFEINCIA